LQEALSLSPQNARGVSHDGDADFNRGLDSLQIACFAAAFTHNKLYCARNTKEEGSARKFAARNKRAAELDQSATLSAEHLSRRELMRANKPLAD
jgi:hypothetical protein